MSATLDRVHKYKNWGYLLIFGIYFGVKLLTFMPMKLTVGTVVDIGQQKNGSGFYTRAGGGSPGYYPSPIFTFLVHTNDAGDSTYTVEDKSGGSIYDDYTIGMPLKVCYNPEHPENARVYAFSAFWLPVVNIVLLLLGSFVWMAANYIYAIKDIDY